MKKVKIIYNNDDNCREIMTNTEDAIMEHVTILVTENPYFFCAAVFDFDSGLLMYEIWD